jgi:hypothetical protein
VTCGQVATAQEILLTFHSLNCFPELAPRSLSRTFLRVDISIDGRLVTEPPVAVVIERTSKRSDAWSWAAPVVV